MCGAGLAGPRGWGEGQEKLSPPQAPNFPLPRFSLFPPHLFPLNSPKPPTHHPLSATATKQQNNPVDNCAPIRPQQSMAPPKRDETANADLITVKSNDLLFMRDNVSASQLRSTIASFVYTLIHNNAITSFAFTPRTCTSVLGIIYTYSTMRAAVSSVMLRIFGSESFRTTRYSLAHQQFCPALQGINSRYPCVNAARLPLNHNSSSAASVT